MTEPPTLSAAEFEALCTLLWGERWRHDAAEALGVGLRNVQFWAAEPPARSKPVPPGVALDLADMIAARKADPEEAARMDAAADRVMIQALAMARALGSRAG